MLQILIIIALALIAAVKSAEVLELKAQVRHYKLRIEDCELYNK
jgi:hypothetical protein